MIYITQLECVQVASGESSFLPFMKTNGPRKEAFLPSSLAFFTRGQSFSLTALSSGDSASAILSLLSSRNLEPFASLQTTSRTHRSANRMMVDLLEPSCRRCPKRCTMSTLSSRLARSLGAVLPRISIVFHLMSSPSSSFMPCTLRDHLRL